MIATPTPGSTPGPTCKCVPGSDHTAAYRLADDGKTGSTWLIVDVPYVLFDQVGSPDSAAHELRTALLLLHPRISNVKPIAEEGRAELRLSTVFSVDSTLERVEEVLREMGECSQLRLVDAFALEKQHRLGRNPAGFQPPTSRSEPKKPEIAGQGPEVLEETIAVLGKVGTVLAARGNSISDIDRWRTQGLPEEAASRLEVVRMINRFLKGEPTDLKSKLAAAPRSDTELRDWWSERRGLKTAISYFVNFELAYSSALGDVDAIITTMDPEAVVEPSRRAAPMPPRFEAESQDLGTPAIDTGPVMGM